MNCAQPGTRPNLRRCDLCGDRLAIRCVDGLVICGVCQPPTERQTREAATSAIHEAIIKLEAAIALRACRMDPDCSFLDLDWLQFNCRSARVNLLTAVVRLVATEAAPQERKS